jgi:mannose-6-phosphate isomerase-like protein (cupin superfamily)
LDNKVYMVREADVMPSIFENGTCTRLITRERENTTHVSFSICRMDGGPWGREISHADKDEALYLIEGEAELAFDGRLYDWPVGACLYVPQGEKYRVHPKTGLVFAVIQSPPAMRSEWARRPDLVVLEREDALRGSESHGS